MLSKDATYGRNKLSQNIIPTVRQKVLLPN